MVSRALIGLWLGAAGVAAFAQSPAKPPSPPAAHDKALVLQPDDIVLNGTANLVGDPAKPGPYIVRTRLAPNTKNRARFYDQDRWVTVLKGTWWVGQGDVFRTDRLVALREGGLFFQPANARAYDMAADGEVILQVSGSGPAKATHAEVDVNGAPVAPGGPYPEDAAPAGRGRGRGGRRGQPPPTQQQ